ncbi:L-histidine N(alpha)-methyltransferase [Cryomorphaceae bacterium 1068]|nr:L-histidine N(alpha)-methyltransferase [Cryomorphaceae bacterium 1068]
MGLAEDVAAGLSSEVKYLLSKYFYDAEGDQLFQQIMKMPEYYLTDCEYEIFSTRGADILKAFSKDSKPFDLLEFGAGDGTKTRILLKRLLENGADFRYVPIDISKDVLENLKKDLSEEFPQLTVRPENADYFSALDNVRLESDRPKLVLFIGSSIGNFREEVIHRFMAELYKKLNSGDEVLLGYDLMKNPQTILRAYNDPTGITKAFNLNILRRINRELGADFNIEAFEHYPYYDPETGLAKSYLVSLKQQIVKVDRLDQTFQFEVGEVIHTEISRKFRVEDIETYFEKAGFDVVEHFYDCKHYFVDTLVKKP